jgi:serine/threonine-protein kinase RsbW
VPATLRLKNRLSELERLDGFLADFGNAHRLPAKAVFELKLALDELVTNVISYGYDDSADHEIELRLYRTGGELTAELEDDGKPFDPLSAPTPDVTQAIDERPIGGLGIYLARQATDALEYRRRDGRNLLVMKKRVGDEPGGA